MTFDPMTEPYFLLAGIAVVVAAAVIRTVQARSIARAGAWLGRILLVVLVAAMLLRPGIPGGAQTVEATQADVFFVVDTTSSIIAEDGDGGRPRLDAMREDIVSLIGQLSGARFAMISFDQTPTLRVPLTTDAAAVISAAQVLRPELSAHARASSIGLAADLLHEQIRGAVADAPERARAVFYFGDGEQTAATAPESFAESAPYLTGGTVFGYGTSSGGPMKITDGRAAPAGYLLDHRTGQPAISVIDPANLRVIAGELGVAYRHHQATAAVSPGELHASTWTEDGQPSSPSVTELYWIPAIGVFALILCELGRLLLAILFTFRRKERA